MLLFEVFFPKIIDVEKVKLQMQSPEALCMVTDHVLLKMLVARYMWKLTDG